MIDPASLILVSLDLLLRETAASSSALIINKLVFFHSFLFSQIKLSPVTRIAILASINGSSDIS